MKVKKTLPVLLIFLMLVSLAATGCVSYYPPMFGHIDGIYVAPTGPEQENDTEVFSFDATVEADVAQIGGFFTSGIMTFAVLQAAGTGNLSMPVSENNLVNLALTAGAMFGVADEQLDSTLFGDGFLYSLGGFGQVDLMQVVRAGNVQYSPGISYTASYEALGSYFSYRKNESELQLGNMERFCSQASIYLDILVYDSNEIISFPFFLRPFLGCSSIASLNPFMISEGLKEYVSDEANYFEWMGALFHMIPDIGCYIGYRDKQSIYLKLKIAEYINYSCSLGFSY